jgi:hypothetical protein
MAANVLNSGRAIEVSVYVVRPPCGGSPLTDFVTFGEHLHVVVMILRSQIGTSSFGGSDA